MLTRQLVQWRRVSALAGGIAWSRHIADSFAALRHDNAEAKTNAGILRCAQNDTLRRTTTETLELRSRMTARRYGSGTGVRQTHTYPAGERGVRGTRLKRRREKSTCYLATVLFPTPLFQFPLGLPPAGPLPEFAGAARRVRYRRGKMFDSLLTS